MDYYKEYLIILKEGLIEVIKSVLNRIANYGLEGKQNLIIRFQNSFNEELSLDNDGENFTTISIQNNSQNLQCSDKDFSVNVNINGQNRRITIPFNAISLILDPSARFGIEFGKEYENSKSLITITEEKEYNSLKNYKVPEDYFKNFILKDNHNVILFDDKNFDKSMKKNIKLIENNPKSVQYQQEYLSMMRHNMIIVIRNILNLTIEKKLQNKNCLIIEFRKNFPGVFLPPFISNTLPKNEKICSIKLQYEYFNLMVHKDNFSVVLSFQEQLHKIIIPFKSIYRLIDPDKNFKIDMSFVNTIDEHFIQQEYEKLIFFDFENIDNESQK